MFRYNDMYPLIEEWRNINKHHSELKAYAYTERSNFADQVASPFSEIQGKPLDCCPARNRMGNIAVWSCLYGRFFCLPCSGHWFHYRCDICPTLCEFGSFRLLGSMGRRYRPCLDGCSSDEYWILRRYCRSYQLSLLYRWSTGTYTFIGFYQSGTLDCSRTIGRRLLEYRLVHSTRRIEHSIRDASHPH